MAYNNFQRFVGKVAIVTGSSYGIGYSVAKRLAIEGAKVIIASRKKDNIEKAANELRSEGLDVTGVVCHVSNSEDRIKLFKEAERLGGLDIIMMNAGVNPSVTPVLETPESAWDKTFDVNVKSSYMLCKEALPLLQKSKSGRVIFMSTIATFHHVNQLGAYSISKLALLGLTKFVALELGKYNITVNAVAPGVINTQFSQVLVKDQVGRDTFIDSIPLNRYV